MKTPVEDWFCCVDCDKKPWIEEKIRERNEAKKNKDYAKADAIRAELLENGILIEDSKDGTTWKTKA